MIPRMAAAPNHPAVAMPLIASALCPAVVAGAMVLPYVPGRYDPLASGLAQATNILAFGSLLLALPGVAWLISGREYVLAKAALGVAMLLSASAAFAMAATTSLAAGAVMIVAPTVWMVRCWRRIGAARRQGRNLSRAIPAALILGPLLVVLSRMVLVEAAGARGRERAIANAAELIGDIEGFRDRTGAYPVALNSLWPDYFPGIIGIERYRYEPNGDAYNLYFEYPSTTFGLRDIDMYNPRGEHDFSSHAFDLLRLSPAEVRRQRGYFRSETLPQPDWKRFLFD
jgi:hypothetical protein